ncbi:MAG: homoserine dehydrogenase [Candidatus Omnitrophota bacterium]
MKKLNIGLIGCGVVGIGVVRFLSEHKQFFKKRFATEFTVKTLCDLDIANKRFPLRVRAKRTTRYQDVVEDPSIDVVIELIGGTKPAADIILGSLRSGKHIITANKELLALRGKEIFREAIRRNRHIYFETSVGAGIPLINSIAEGLAGNKFRGLYGIINGTCNFILSQMTNSNLTFSEALKDAQKRGFAESNPTLDINGMDSAHKLAILVFLTLGKFIKIKNIHLEGISHISSVDIEYAKSLNLTIKLLAIAKKVHGELEVRVHPTLIANSHPLASIHGVNNAVYLDTYPLGEVMISGQGAGQKSAAMGVISDLLKLSARLDGKALPYIATLAKETSKIRLRRIADIETEFYIRFMAIDKPGVLATISGILGKYGISIASLSQKIRKKSSAVPIVMLTHHVKERRLRLALEKISRLSVIRSKPVAIRMEKL